MQYRLMMLVYLRRSQIAYATTETLALSNLHSENVDMSDQVSSSLERLQSLLLPDVKPKKDRFVEEAKKAMVEEAKKAYLVRPLKGAQGRKSLERIASAGHGSTSRWAAKQLHEEKQAEENLRNRYRSRRGRRPPKGATRDRR